MTEAAEIDTVIDCIDRGGGGRRRGSVDGGEGEGGGGGGCFRLFLHSWGDGCILLRWIAIPRHRSHPSSLQSNPHGSTLSPSIDFLMSAAASAASAAALITARPSFVFIHYIVIHQRLYSSVKSEYRVNNTEFHERHIYVWATTKNATRTLLLKTKCPNA